MGTELGTGSKAVQAVWFGHFTFPLTHRIGAAQAWNNGKAATKRKPGFYTLSMFAQFKGLV